MKSDTYKIEYLPIDKVKLNPNNPRQIKDAKFKSLVKSLADCPDLFGARPLLCSDRTGELIVLGGNMRLRAALELKYKEVPVIIMSNLTESQEQEIAIKDNGTWGEFDFDTLANSWSDLPLVEWGIDLPEDWLKKDEPQNAEPQIDKAAELNKVWQVKTGDLFTIGNHRLLCGDSTKAEDVAWVMGGEKADICFTSPPYNLAENAKLSPHQKGGSKYISDSDDKNEAEYLQFLIEFINNSLLFSDYSFVNIQSLAGNKIVLIDLLSRLKPVYADTLIWDKMNAQPAMAENVLNSQYEFVHVFSKKANRSIGVKKFRGTISNVVSIHKQASEIKEHNATFPIQFAGFFVENFSNSTILDPFLGSGTTMVACQNLNRKCRGIEISPAYCAVILERMATAFPGIEIRRLD